MSTLYMMVGIPASGKSTMTKKLQAGGCKVVSTDEIREELGCLTDMSRNTEVFSIAKQRLRESLSKGDTVFDATNIRIKGRAEIMDCVKDLNCCKVAMVFDKDLGQCKLNNKFRENQVPESVIENMHSRFEMPTESEGFDVIVTYK